jgi:hypothetical protein
MSKADERGTPVAYDLWDAQVALANHLTKHPGCEGDLAPVIGFIGPPPGWVPSDGLIDPEERPPPPEVLAEMREQEAKDRARVAKQERSES